MRFLNLITGGIVRLISLISIAGVLLNVSVAQAQTSVSGLISANTTWRAADGPFVVNADLAIQGNAILTIEAGTVIYMGPNTSVTVLSGSIQAIGSAVTPIKVLSDKVRAGQTPAPGDWNNWLFNNNATPSSLNYVQFDHGKGIKVTSSTLNLNNSQIRNQLGTAISQDLASSLIGTGNSASGNTVNAITVPAGDISATVRWALKGIPYFVQSGVVSVGVSPQIDSISPGSILAGDTVTFTVNGSRLSGASNPTWSITGLSAEMLAGGSATQARIRVFAPITATAGNADLYLLTDAGEVTKSLAITVQRNQPRLDAVTPASVLTLAGVTTLNLTGAFFVPNTRVELDGQALTTTAASATQIQANLPEQTTPGTRQLRLRTPDTLVVGSDLFSNNVAITISQPQVSFDPAQASMVAGLSQAVTLRLPFAAPAGGLAFNLSSTAPAIAGVPSSVSVSAGNTTVSFSIQGVGIGQAQIAVSRTGWVTANLAASVITPPVTLAYTPVTSYLVGVQVGTATAAGNTTATFEPLTSNAVGVLVGSVATTMAPKIGVVGTQVSLQISGQGLNAISNISFVPPEGIVVGIPSVNAAGQLLNLALTIDATAPKSLRRVVLRTADGVVRFIDATQSQFLVAAPAPELESVSPQVIVAGQAATKLSIRGRNLRDITGLRFEPAQGLSTVGSATVNAEGTLLEISALADAAAVSGLRTVIVVAAGGESTAVQSPANTIQVARQIGNAFKDVSSSLVGVVVGSANTQTSSTLDIGPVLSPQVGVMVGSVATTSTQTFDPVNSPLVGVVVGAGAFDLSPKAGVVGTTVTLTIQGSGLNAVTAVRMVPPDGVSVGVPTANGSGTQVSVQMVIAASATKSQRKIVLGTADLNMPTIPFVLESRSQFLVAGPAALLESISPQVLVAGQPQVKLTVRGQNLRDIAGVRFEPAQGITVLGAPSNTADGNAMELTVKVESGALSGARTLIVTTPGGNSSAVPVAGNTIQVAQQIAGPFNDLSSALVGVQVGTATTAYIDPRNGYSQPVGVVVGSMVTGLASAGAIKGTNGNLQLSGVGLDVVSGVQLYPSNLAQASGVTLGAPVISAGGTLASVPYTISATAPSQSYRIVLTSVSGTSTASIPVLSDSATIWRVQTLPVISSFEPLVLQQGRAYDLVVRGSDLAEAQGLVIEPSTGITFENKPLIYTTDALGPKVSFKIIVSPTAATGARIVRLQTPAGLTDGQSATGNTLNVVAP